MTVLLTGGTGYIGSHTAVALLNAGIDVIIADNLYNSCTTVLSGIKKITGKSTLFYDIDTSKREQLDRLFSEREINAVIHLAGYKATRESVTKPLLYYRNNLNTTFALLETMDHHNCHSLVFSSSASVYGERNSSPLREDMSVGDCKSPYAYSKFMNERILTDVACANNRMSIVLLRYFNPVGAHPSGLIGERPTDYPANIMPQVIEAASNVKKVFHVYGNDYPTRDGTCIRDYIHVMDLAEGHVSAIKYAMEHFGVDVFNLGTGNGTSVLELLETFSQVNCVNISYKIYPRREGDIPVCYANADKALRILGWKAHKNLEDMCRDAWRWYRTSALG